MTNAAWNGLSMKPGIWMCCRHFAPPSELDPAATTQARFERMRASDRVVLLETVANSVADWFRASSPSLAKPG